jgi:hypothetical protein
MKTSNANSHGKGFRKRRETSFSAFVSKRVARFLIKYEEHKNTVDYWKYCEYLTRTNYPNSRANEDETSVVQVL